MPAKNQTGTGKDTEVMAKCPLRGHPTSDSNMEDVDLKTYCGNLGVPVEEIEVKSWLEFQKERKIARKLKKTENGYFTCPYEAIPSHIKEHVEERHTNEKLSVTDVIPPSDLETEVMESFSLDLEAPEEKIGFLEIQKARKINKFALKLKKTKNGHFKCPHEDTCDFVSAYPGNVKVHMRRHTNEKPFVCDICRKDFKFQSNWKNHIMTHPEMNAVKCKHCNRKISQENIESHVEKCSKRPKRKQRRTGGGTKREYTEIASDSEF